MLLISIFLLLWERISTFNFFKELAETKLKNMELTDEFLELPNFISSFRQISSMLNIRNPINSENSKKSKKYNNNDKNE